MSGRMTIEEISKASGYSSRQLHRWFDEYLDEYPTWTIRTRTPVYLLVDGTYYSDNHCLIVYRAENIRRTLFYRFSRSEDDDEIASDLMNIRAMGYEVLGITTDGGDNIVRAVEFVYPDVPRQRCMVHVQRECLNSITHHPRSPEARMLRNLVLRLNDVKSTNDKLWWLSMYRRWVEDNPDLPRTTNSLEAFFGHIKDQLRLHRGLSETRVDNFIKWYLYFNDEKKKNK